MAVMTNTKRMDKVSAPLVGKFVIVYVHLWILEGAARKWVPGMENIFYVARDVLVLGVLLSLLLRPLRRRTRSTGLLVFILVFILGILFAAVSNVTPIAVMVLGIRSYVFPLIVVYLASTYAGNDLFSRIVRNLIPYAFVMFTVVVMQVLSAPDSMINWQVGTEEAYFTNDGVVRASGTFSSPAGMTGFLPILLIAALWAFQKDRGWRRSVAAISVLFTLATIGLSGSRGAVLSGLIILGVYALRVVLTWNIIHLIRNIFLFGACAVFVVYLVDLFPSVVASFSDRFESAAATESSTERILTQAFEYLFWSISVLGDGAGMRMHAGAALGSSLQWVEFDNTKIVAELGLLGWSIVGFKVIFGCFIFIRHSLIQVGSTLELCLVSSVLGPLMVYGVITQYPSAQAAFGILLTMWITQKHQTIRQASSNETTAIRARTTLQPGAI